MDSPKFKKAYDVVIMGLPEWQASVIEDYVNSEKEEIKREVQKKADNMQFFWQIFWVVLFLMSLNS